MTAPGCYEQGWARGTPSLYAWQCRGRRWAWSTYQPILRDRAGKGRRGRSETAVQGVRGPGGNGINTVHLSYVRARTGPALIDARQWIPQEHIEDPVKSLVMGLPY